MAKITLARALRERKTLAGKISEARQRASSSSVVDEGDEPDFDTAEQLALHGQRQAELRKLKVETAKESAKALVKIPEDAPVPEAGQEVGVSHAVLIRDDLKGQRSLLTDLTTIPLVVRDRYSIREEEVKKRVRKFDFQETLEKIDNLQLSIDAIDSAIQYKNNNWVVEI